MKVLKAFYDKEDERQHYPIGRDYPRKGLKPTQKRIDHLVKLGHIEEQPKQGAKKDS